MQRTKQFNYKHLLEDDKTEFVLENIVCQIDTVTKYPFLSFVAYVEIHAFLGPFYWRLVTNNSTVTAKTTASFLAKTVSPWWLEAMSWINSSWRRRGSSWVVQVWCYRYQGWLKCQKARLMFKISSSGTWSIIITWSLYTVTHVHSVFKTPSIMGLGVEQWVWA